MEQSQRSRVGNVWPCGGVGSDYAAQSGALIFPNGTTTQTIEVSVNGDPDDEGNEAFFINLTNPRNATITDAQGQCTIINDDAPVLPEAPGNLMVITTGTATAEVSWNDNSNNENGFKLERKTSDAAFAEIAVLGANSNSFRDTGLNPATVYAYRVHAFNADGPAIYSNEHMTETASRQVNDPNVNLAFNQAAMASSTESGSSRQTQWTAILSIPIGAAPASAISRRPGCAWIWPR